MNTSQPKLFTQEYALNRIEANWKMYNNTAPKYDISFDATILKLYTHPQEENKNTSETLQRDFSEASERLQNELKKQPADIDAIMDILSDNYEGFLQFISENFENTSVTLHRDFIETSERVRRDFGDTSESLRRTFGDNTAVLLLLIILNKNTTAKEAAKIIGVSERVSEA